MFKVNTNRLMYTYIYIYIYVESELITARFYVVVEFSESELGWFWEPLRSTNVSLHKKFWVVVVIVLSTHVHNSA